MNLDDREERDLAAAEYVVGTLQGEDRQRFDAALATDVELQREVYAWQDRLLPMAGRAAPVLPAAALWDRIERRLPELEPVAKSSKPEAANDATFTRRLRRWQSFSGLATAASVVLATALWWPSRSADEPRYLTVLAAPDKSAGWVVEVTADRRVRLVPVAVTPGPPSDKVLQFWTKPDGAAGPTSLGVVRAGQVTELPVDRLPAVGERQLFELTLEPPGGSTIGRPTGPVLYVGRSVRL